MAQLCLRIFTVIFSPKAAEITAIANRNLNMVNDDMQIDVGQ